MREIDDPDAPDRPLTSKGPVIRDVRRQIRRLGLSVYAALAIAVLGVAVMLTLFARDQRKIAALERANAAAAYEQCVDRNRRAEASGGALAKLVAASRADRNPASARVWEEFVRASRATPLPTCTPPAGVR